MQKKKKEKILDNGLNLKIKNKTMCNCLNEMETLVKEKFISNQKENGNKIHEFIDESESGFQCKGLMFSSGKWEFTLPMEYKYILEKKDGTPEKRTSKYKTNFIPSFCPICGEKKELNT